MSEKDTLILAIESSCDETAASVVKNGRCVLSNIFHPRSPSIPCMAVLCRKLHPENISKKSTRL